MIRENPQLDELQTGYGWFWLWPCETGRVQKAVLHSEIQIFRSPSSLIDLILTLGGVREVGVPVSCKHWGKKCVFQRFENVNYAILDAGCGSLVQPWWDLCSFFGFVFISLLTVGLLQLQWLMKCWKWRCYWAQGEKPSLCRLPTGCRVPGMGQGEDLAVSWGWWAELGAAQTNIWAAVSHPGWGQAGCGWSSLGSCPSSSTPLQQKKHFPFRMKPFVLHFSAEVLTFVFFWFISRKAQPQTFSQINRHVRLLLAYLLFQCETNEWHISLAAALVVQPLPAKIMPWECERKKKKKKKRVQNLVEW